MKLRPILATMILAATATSVTPTVQAETGSSYLISGHRGTRVGAPENTMSAFRYAKKHDADMIEFDVFWTKDQKMVVIHDATLNRTTNGTGWVKNHSFKYIRSLDAGSWYGSEFAGEKVPTFEEVIAYAKANNLLMNAEIKGNVGGPTDKITSTQAKAYIKALKDAGMLSKTTMSSDSHSIVRSIQALKSGIVTGDIAMEKPEAKASISSYGKAYMPTWQLFTPGNVATLQRLGVKVFIWPIRNEDDWNHALATHADVMVVDDPGASYVHH